MLKHNCFINANKLCKLYNDQNPGKPKKEFKHWNELKQSKDMISSLAKILTSENVITISINDTVSIDLRGTYVHPKLIPHIASWISVEFAFKVSDIVNEYFNKEMRKLLTTKDDKIDELNKKIDDLLVYAKETKQELIETHLDINDTRFDFKEMYQTLNETNSELNDKLDIVLEQRVLPESNSNKTTSFRLIKMFKSYTSKDVTYTYYVRRGQKLSINRENLYKGDTILILDSLPNAQNLFNKIKETLPYIAVKRNFITLVSETEDKLLEDIKKINESKYVVEVVPKTKEEILYETTNKELYKLCRVMKYKGYSSYTNKRDLVTFILSKGY